MPQLVDIGKRAGMVLGAKLFTAAGQLFYASASGTADVLAAPTVANQPLVASSGLLPSWGAPSGAVAVASDVTHAQSDTSLSNVTGLAVPIGSSATEIWFFEAFLLMKAANTTVDMKFGWSVPTSATMKWGALGNAASIASFSILGGVASSPTALAAAGDTLVAPSMNGTIGVSLAAFIFGGGTSGNVQLQFAQNTSTAVDLTVQKGSMLRYRRLAT